MRITNNMMINNMLRNLNRTMLRLDKRQMQGYTGKRIHKASDDPVATSRVLKTKADISQLKQYQKNVDDAVSWLENTESSVENINKAVHRIRDIAVQAANGVLTAEETQKINEEIKQLKEQIISLGNTTYGSSYIFSGKKIDKPLLDENGYYNIDLKDYLNPYMVDDKKDVQVGSRENIGVNTLGFEIFEGFEKPVIYSLDVDGTSNIILTLPNGEVIDTEETNINDAIEKLKEMSVEHDSPLKGYKFEEVSIDEWDGSSVEVKTYIKAIPTDALAVDSKTASAIWETGDIDTTSLDLSDGKTATFTFMGITINIESGTVTDPDNTDPDKKIDIKDVNAKGATIVVDDSHLTDLTSEELTDELAKAFGEIAKEPNSKIEGFNFKADTDKLMVIAPESAGGRYNKEVYTATLEGDGNLKDINVDLVVEGAGESKSVAKGQKAGIIQLIEKLEKEMMEGNNEEIGNLLDTIDIYHRTILTAKSEIGAKVNRMKLVSDRIEGDIINFRELQSQLEDADMAETLMELMNEENVYRSALAMGARIIQPSLLDFLR